MKKFYLPAVFLLFLFLSPSCKKEKPEAFFTIKNNGCIAPCEVEFNDQSQNAVTLSWDFDDGNSDQNKTQVKHLYNLPGEYTVTLKAVNTDGSDIHTDTVRILPPVGPPTVDFSIQNNNCNASCTVSFTAITQNADSVAWDFGHNGAKSSFTTASYTYNSAGEYTVTLTAFGPGGTNAVTKKVTIQNQQTLLPIAAFSASKTQCSVGETVSFTNNSQHATEFLWDFGNGKTSISSTTTSTYYDTPGSYNVQLTARNASNQSDVATKTITVVGSGPTRVFVERITISEIPDFWWWDLEDDTGPDLTFNFWRYLGNDEWESLLYGYTIEDASDEYGEYYWDCNSSFCEVFNWDSGFVITVDDEDNPDYERIAQSQYIVLNDYIGQTEIDLSGDGMTIILQLRWE